MPGRWEHVVEVVDLWVLADFTRTDDQIDGNERKIRLQLADKRDGRILGVTHTEDDLEIGVILAGKGGIILIRLEVRSA